jgi:cytoskeletal protein RodZ
MRISFAGGFAYLRLGMEEIGRTLLETREQLGLTLDEAERVTRIRVHHLEAIERGDLEALPSPVQARGFLNNYADFLGLDAEVILLQYAETLQTRRNRDWSGVSLREPGTRPSVQVRSRRPRWLSIDLFVAATITLAIISVFVWGVSRVMAVIRQPTEATEMTTGFTVSTSTPQPTESPDVTEPTVASSFIEIPEATTIPTQPILFGLTDTINLKVVIEKRSWVLVVVDGEEVLRGRVKAGEIFEYQGGQVVELATGNGAGLRVYYNGQDQGLLGEVGQVVVRLWTLDGVLTPTATVTRTPLATPQITDTQPPTLTITPSPGS